MRMAYLSIRACFLVAIATEWEANSTAVAHTSVIPSTEMESV